MFESEIRIITPVWYGAPAPWSLIICPFTFSLCVSLWMSFADNIYLGFVFDPSASLSLTGELRPFLLIVIRETCLLVPINMQFF